MKPINITLFVLIFSSSVVAQENKKQDHEKRDNHVTFAKGNDDRIEKHDKIIWAGTGVKLNDKSKDAKSIPDAVLNSFNQYFPNQPIDNVRKFRGLYAITFSNPTYTTTLVYKADGTFVEARTVATDSILPETVRNEARHKKGEYDTDEVVVIEKADKQKFYRLHFKNDSAKPYIVFNESGKEVDFDY